MDDDRQQEPGFDSFFALLLLGCVVHVIALGDCFAGRWFWSPVLLVVTTLLLMRGYAAYAHNQGRHPLWGILGVLGLFGLFLLLILPEFEGMAEEKRHGFAVLGVGPAKALPVWDENEGVMRVNVKLFAILRERAGESELVLHLRPGATIADAIRSLGDRFPDIQTFLPRVACALNESYVKSDAALSEGDELALIPPVSGGTSA